MPALNFKERFAHAVESGAKTQTIRKPRNIKVGDTVQLFVGQRTKQCRRLGTGIVKNVVNIIIDDNDDYRLSVDGVYAEPHKELELANDDGFQSFEDFMDFFRSHYSFPFCGILIKWELS